MPQAPEQAADSLGFEENTEGRRDSPRVQNTAEKILEGQGLSPQLHGRTLSVSQKPCKAWFGEGRTVLTRWDSACVNALLPVLPPPGEGRAAQAGSEEGVQCAPAGGGGGGLCMVCWCFSLISKRPGGPGSIGSPSVWTVGPRLPAILHSEGGQRAAPL